MFCPRCGVITEEGLKFCRNCGLPIAPITSYIASGGTKDLILANSPPPLTRSGFTLKQVLALRIAASLLLPAAVGILASFFGLADEVIGLAALLAPFLILLSIFRYRAQAMQLRIPQTTQSQSVMSPPPPPPALMKPKNTNPLNPAPPVSVIEDETVRFPEKRS
jgi:hypothetical protein